MDCTITGSKNYQPGFTLVEMLIAIGIGMIVLATVAMFTLYSARSFASLGNYVTLDQQSRNTLDTMSKEIRQAASVQSSSTTNILTLTGVQADGATTYTVTYQYDPGATTFTRTVGGNATLMLTNCVYLSFNYYTRVPTTNFDQFAATSPGSAKVVEVTWYCQRSVLGKFSNTERVQASKIVLRKF
jgi:type II secretory pathway pseudopilin PulG